LFVVTSAEQRENMEQDPRARSTFTYFRMRNSDQKRQKKFGAEEAGPAGKGKTTELALERGRSSQSGKPRHQGNSNLKKLKVQRILPVHEALREGG